MINTIPHLNVAYHTRRHDNVHVAVKRVIAEIYRDQQPYPVLIFGEITIWPNDDQLRTLQAALETYFKEEKTNEQTTEQHVHDEVSGGSPGQSEPDVSDDDAPF